MFYGRGADLLEKAYEYKTVKADFQDAFSEANLIISNPTELIDEDESQLGAIGIARLSVHGLSICARSILRAGKLGMRQEIVRFQLTRSYNKFYPESRISLEEADLAADLLTM